MLMIAIPSDESAGTCLINARPYEFRIVGAEFWFRGEGEANEWDRRPVIARTPNGRETVYICGPASDDAIPRREPTFHERLQQVVIDCNDQLERCWA